MAMAALQASVRCFSLVFCFYWVSFTEIRRKCFKMVKILKGLFQVCLIRKPHQEQYVKTESHLKVTNL